MQISFAAAVASSVLLLCIAPLLLSSYLCLLVQTFSKHTQRAGRHIQAGTHSRSTFVWIVVFVVVDWHFTIILVWLFTVCSAAAVSVFIAGECIFCCCWCCCARSTLPRDCIDWMAAAAAVCACTCQRRGPQRMRAAEWRSSGSHFVYSRRRWRRHSRRIKCQVMHETILIR